MKQRIKDHILLLLSLAVSCYAFQLQEVPFQKPISPQCTHSSENSCFPFIIYSRIDNFAELSQIVYTMRFRNYVYKPNTSSFLNESDNFKYEATFVNMTDPLTFNYTSINYTTYSNYTSVINNTALKFGMATFNVQALSQETEANYIVIQITEPSS